MAKGGAFEREISKELSLWWTHGSRDDIFWRSTSSGGRATVRKKAGKSTHGSYGDITALDPIGQPFLDVFTVEVKRGYSRKICLLDCMDKKDGPKPLIIQWVEQAQKSAKAARSPHWLIIMKRDRRDKLVICPMKLFDELPSLDRCLGSIQIGEGRICLFRYDYFFNSLSVEKVKTRARGLR